MILYVDDEQLEQAFDIAHMLGMEYASLETVVHDDLPTAIGLHLPDDVAKIIARDLDGHCWERDTVGALVPATRATGAPGS